MGYSIQTRNLTGKNLMSKMNLYTGTLCLIYQSVFIINGKRLKWRAALSAIIIFSLILFMNIMFLLAIFLRPISPSVTFFVFTILFVLNYFIFILGKRYEILEEEYNRIKVLYKWLYFLFFLILTFLTVFLGFFELKLRTNVL